MNPKVFAAKSKDPDYLIKYSAILDDVGTLHKYAVDWVKEHEVFEDEAAIHAMAFTIRKEAMDLMNDRNLVVYTPSKETRKNLVDFQLYKQTVNDPIEAFVALAAEITEHPINDVRETMNHIPQLTRRTFLSLVADYLELALGIKADLDGDHEQALEHWERALEIED